MFINLKHTLVIAMLCLATATYAAGIVAILEITPSNDEMDLTIEETRFLTDELRRQAIRFLPKDYTVLSRDKIISLVPQTAENLTSVIDIGLVIKSDYVTRGSIGKLGNLFTLTVELYETTSSNLLGDFVKESTDLKGLLDAIRENASELFSKLNPSIITKPEATVDTQPATISANVPAEPKKKSSNSTWVAIGLDVLGAAALGIGTYSNVKVGNYRNEAEKANTPSEFESKNKKMQDMATTRNILYATGGALLLGGVAVHIWF